MGNTVCDIGFVDSNSAVAALVAEMLTFVASEEATAVRWQADSV